MKKLLMLIFLAPALSADSMKTVLVADFININQDASFQYLEISITDAVKKMLKDRFVFRATNPQVVKEVAENNFIYRNDFHTRTAAMNLGLLSKTDIVIAGGYIIEKPVGKTAASKKAALNSGADFGNVIRIKTSVRILDISKKQVIADFTETGPADDRIFNTIGKIADRIAKEARVVLPNKETWARGEVAEEIPALNQISIRSGFYPLGLDAQSRQVYQNSEHTAADLKNIYSFGLDFQHFGILHRNLGLLGGAELRSAQDNFSIRLSGEAVPVNLLAFSFHAAAAWRLPLSNRFYLQPLAGGGMSYDIIKMTFDNKAVAATSASGQVINISEYANTAPFARAGLRIGYQLKNWLALELGINYFYSFYSSSSAQTASADLGVGFIL